MNPEYQSAAKFPLADALRRLASMLVTAPLPVFVLAQSQPAVPSPVARAVGSGAALVLNHVTVIDVEHGQRWREQRVIVAGNRIRAMGPVQTIRVPPGARVVDARGKYLIPGLWDLHMHPGGLGGVPPDQMSFIANTVYRELLAAGITGIRDAGSPISLDTFRVWKREIAAGGRVGPRLIVSGPSIEFNPSRECMRDHQGACATTLLAYITRSNDAPHLVDSLKAAGADMIKIHNVPRPIWFAIAAEARRVGIPFGGHFNTGHSDRDSLPKTVDGLVASDSGPVILDHQLYADACGFGIDSLLSLRRCTAAATRLRRNHTWVTPQVALGDPRVLAPRPQLPDAFWQRAFRYALTNTMNENLPAWGIPAWRPLSAAERRQLPTGTDWAAALAAVHGDSATTTQGCQMARLAYAADLPWVTGPDWPLAGFAGTSVHLHLLFPVLCGVPPLWALQAATLNPARALGLSDSLGTVAVGKVADLVLLDGDPLEDIWNVSKTAAVVANGRYYDRGVLDHLLVDASERWGTIRTMFRQAEEAQKQADKDREENGIDAQRHP